MTQIILSRSLSHTMGKLSSILAIPLRTSVIIAVGMCVSTRCLAQPSPTPKVSSGIVVVDGQPQQDGQGKPSKSSPESKGKPATPGKEGESPTEGSNAEKKNEGPAEPIKGPPNHQLLPTKKNWISSLTSKVAFQFQFRIKHARCPAMASGGVFHVT